MNARIFRHFSFFSPTANRLNRTCQMHINSKSIRTRNLSRLPWYHFFLFFFCKFIAFSYLLWRTLNSFFPPPPPLRFLRHLHRFFLFFLKFFFRLSRFFQFSLFFLTFRNYLFFFFLLIQKSKKKKRGKNKNFIYFFKSQQKDKGMRCLGRGRGEEALKKKAKKETQTFKSAFSTSEKIFWNEIKNY